MSRQKILMLVITVVQEIAQDRSDQMLTHPTESTKLFSETLDSIELVTLIAELEERIVDEFGFHIVLADDRAMSRKTSPFRSIQTLVDYINLLLSEQFKS